MKNIKYWIEVDPRTFMPTGKICFSYYPGDRPVVGNWLEVEWTKDSTFNVNTEDLKEHGFK